VQLARLPAKAWDALRHQEQGDPRGSRLTQQLALIWLPRMLRNVAAAS
jgi:hypothetical protein